MAGREHDELAAYPEAFEKSWVKKELSVVRNVVPLVKKFGDCLGIGAGRHRRCGWSISGMKMPFTMQPPSRPREPVAQGPGQADRLSQARRRADLRPAVVGVPVEHQSRGGPAGPPDAARPDDPGRIRSADVSTSRRSDIARPACTRSSARRRATRSSSSTRRIASTARRATSRTRPRTSTGWCRKAAVARIIRTCEAQGVLAPRRR